MSFAAGLRGLREKAGSPAYRVLGQRAHFSAGRLSEAAGGRVLPSLAVTLAYVRACDGDEAEWEPRWREVAEHLTQRRAPSQEHEPEALSSPYVGLAAFQPADAERFFGREALVDELVTRLSRRRFLAVFGASGAGKSSLLRAGLIARLEAAAKSLVILVVPGVYPLRECAIGLAAHTGRTAAQVLADLLADPRNLTVTLLEALADRAPRSELVLVIDQFEEVFTLCSDERERAAFIGALLEPAQAADGRVRVVIGVRADFYSHCSNYPALAGALNDHQMLIGPMNADELRRAVTQPAINAKCSVEAALLAEIMTQAAGQAGALPLVSHALQETWRRRRGNTLTLAGYQAAGGVTGALANSAEHLYESLTPSQQQHARQLFVRMTALGEGTEDTSRRISRTELDGHDDLTIVLNRLADARLVTLEEDTVAIAHEALIGAWPRLRGWLTDNRADLHTHRHLTEAAHAWTAMARDPGSLYRGARLESIREWAAREHNSDTLNAAEQAFLQASVAAAAADQQATVRRNRRLRSLSAALALLLLAAVAIGVEAVRNRSEAVRASELALSRQLAAQAMELYASQPATAKLLSVQAYRTTPTLEARSALLSLAARQEYRSELAHGDAVSQVTFSPDGTMVATAGKDQKVRLWDTARGALLATLTSQSTWVKALTFSPDGRWLAIGGDDSNLLLWDVENGLKSTPPSRPAAAVKVAQHVSAARLLTADRPLAIKDIAFSPDGRMIATAGIDSKVKLWDTTRAEQILLGNRPPDLIPVQSLAGHTGLVQSLAFSPDGTTLASGSTDGTIRLWDARRHTPLAILKGHTQSVQDVSFAPDAKTLASASSDQQVMVWNVQRRTRTATLTGHTAPARAVAFSPDHRLLAAAVDDQTIIVWDATTRVRLATLAAHTGPVSSLAFHPTQPILASAGEDGRVIFWNPDGLPLNGHQAPINDLAYAPDGQTLAAASADATVTLWDPVRRSRLAAITNLPGPVNTVVYSPDGRTLATGTTIPPRQRDASTPSLQLHEAATRTPLPLPAGPRDYVHKVTFSPDGHTLAAAGGSHTLADAEGSQPFLWATKPGQTTPALTLNGEPTNLAYSPDGRLLATVTRPSTITLWDMTKSAPTGTIVTEAEIGDIAFSPDSRTLAVASHNQTITLWQVASRTLQRSIPSDGRTTAIAYSPDGRTLATANGLTITLRDPATGRRLTVLSGHTAPVNTIAYSPEGRTLASGSDDNTVILWTLHPQQATTTTCTTLNRNLTQQEWNQFLPDIPYRTTCGQLS